MGYTIKVGNAVPSCTKEFFPRLEAMWKVEDAEHWLAPVPPGDEEDIGKANFRSPSYIAWRDFAETVGLTEFFYNPHRGVMTEHPGCVGITREDLVAVERALIRYRERATLPAGSLPGHDPHLARLEWLAFWMEWALGECETPAIQNW